MDPHNWLVMQILFSVTIILINIILFHLLNAKKLCNQENNDIHMTSPAPTTTEGIHLDTRLATTNSRTNNNNNHSNIRLGMLKRFGMSLSLLHVLSGACLLVITIISLLTHHISGFYPSLGHVEIFTLLMTLTCTMFHMLGIMINDFKTACQSVVLSEENNFYIILTWASTVACTVLMFLVKVDAEITQMFSYIFLATDIFLFLCYIDIVRRSIANRRTGTLMDNHDVHQYNILIHQQQRHSSTGSPNHHLPGGLSRWHSHYHHLFLGVLLTISFIIFSVPFALERFLLRQNYMVSYICVALNSIAQGVIFGIRAYVK